MIARAPRVLFLVALAVMAADRLTKLWASSYLADHGPIEVVPGVFRLAFTTNTGGAFGIFEGVPWLFAAASIAVAAAIVWQARKVRRTGTAVALGLILGGAIGNLADRLSGGLSLRGQVVDFLDFRVWPVFNMADTAIVIGAGILAVASLRKESEAGARGDA